MIKHVRADLRQCTHLAVCHAQQREDGLLVIHVEPEPEPDYRRLYQHLLATGYILYADRDGTSLVIIDEPTSHWPPGSKGARLAYIREAISYCYADGAPRSATSVFRQYLQHLATPDQDQQQPPRPGYRCSCGEQLSTVNGFGHGWILEAADVDFASPMTGVVRCKTCGALWEFNFTRRRSWRRKL